MSPPANEANALQLIEHTGILARTQVITNLNVERDKEQSTFEKILAEIARDKPLATRVIQLANSVWFGAADAIWFTGPEEDSLRSDVAHALSVSIQTVDDTMAEMLRLYRLRQSHA